MIIALGPRFQQVVLLGYPPFLKNVPVVELAPGVAGTEAIRHRIAQSIAGQLRRLKSEFAHYTPQAHQLPQVSLHPAGDPEYFPRAG